MFVILLQCLSNSHSILIFFYLSSLYFCPLKVDFIIFDENPILNLIIFCSPQFQPDPIEFFLQNADVLFHADHFPLVVFDIVVGDFDHPLSIIILISPPQLYQMIRTITGMQNQAFAYSQIATYTRRGRHRPPLSLNIGDTVGPFRLNSKDYYKNF
jgi:hypothetical protein